MTEDQKVRENRLRRAAARQGLRLLKSRTRDPRALSYGGYMLVDEIKNFVVIGADHWPYSASIEDVESYLNGAL